LVIILAAVAGFMIAGFFSFEHVTEQRLIAKRATVKRPGVIDAYRKLFAEIEGRELTAEELPPAGEEVTEFPGFPEDAADIVAEYDRLFARVEAQEDIRDGDIGDIIWYPPDEWTASQKSTLKKYLAANQDLIRQIRHAAARGGPVYPIDFSASSEPEIPYLALLRSCARLLNGDAGIKAAEGEYDESVEDILAGMRLADAVSYEPFMVSQFLRLSIYGIMYDTLQDCFNGADLSPELTLTLMNHVAQADNRHAIIEFLIEDIYFIPEFFSDLRTGDRSVLELRSVTYNASGQPVGPANLAEELTDLGQSFLAGLYASPLGDPWLNMDEATHVDYINRLIVAMEGPPDETGLLLKQMEGEAENLPITRVVSRNSVAQRVGACIAQIRHETDLDLIQMGILLEQYHARTGSYPTSLDAIASDLGGSLPVDPFRGGNYCYRPSGDGFLLYSVGPNLVDDGGDHSFRLGDIVWRGEQ